MILKENLECSKREKVVKNLELKAPLNDYEGCINELEKMSARFECELDQTDTYFRVSSGRLKLRQMADCSELIGYHRANEQSSRLSNYQIMPVSNPSILKQILKETLGVRGVVVKKRYLWLLDNTRIHLDFVKDLGQFIELETVMQHHSIQTATNEHNQIKRRLKICSITPVGESYIDLLIDGFSR